MLKTKILNSHGPFILTASSLKVPRKPKQFRRNSWNDALPGPISDIVKILMGLPLNSSKDRLSRK